MFPNRPASHPPDAHAMRGFTLVELIMVIVMLGILAVYAAPRMFNSNDVYARGFHDETLAYLRYAQKTAIGQRRTVCVNFASSSSLTLSIALNPATFDCATAGTLTGPKGDVASTTLNAKAGSGVAYNTTPALVNFNYNGLGQPITSAGVAAATQTIRVVGVDHSITIESATGYVHE
ncbi:MAG: type II secretion system protein [Burkholderiales bacterium]|nr:type II secretion system protein [Burkholderiales bacterium]